MKLPSSDLSRATIPVGLLVDLGQQEGHQVESITKSDFSRMTAMPRNYQAVYMALIEHCQQANELDEAGRVLAVMRDVLPEEVLPMEPGLGWLATWLESLEAEIAKAR